MNTDDRSVYTNQSPLVTPKVTESEKKMRLDVFLTRTYSDFSRNQVIRLIRAGAVRRAGDTALPSPDDRVEAGERYQITLPEAAPAIPQPEEIALDILYEDADLIVVNKPAGLVVHPGAGNFQGTLVNALLAHCSGSLSGIGGVARPGIVHRLDKDTSGILVAAKNDKTHRALAAQFFRHTIERVYQAFVWGFVKETASTVSGNIGRSPSHRQQMAIVSGGGKPATTHYRRLAVFGGGLASHVQCTLETGRTHQIRVHMSSLGHPLIGDGVYGSPPPAAPDWARFFPRQALHAGFLGFIHPTSGERVRFQAPLPPDLQELLTALQSL